MEIELGPMEEEKDNKKGAESVGRKMATPWFFRVGYMGGLLADISEAQQLWGAVKCKSALGVWLSPKLWVQYVVLLALLTFMV